MTEEPPRAATLPPGYDEEDPYADEDLADYPAWWRRNVEEFQEYGMRPYRPPRFDDGELLAPLVVELEGDLGVEIAIRAVNPHEGNDWELVVDGRVVAPLPRRREGEGYTRYELTAAEFEGLVREAVDEPR